MWLPSFFFFFFRWSQKSEAWLFQAVFSCDAYVPEFFTSVTSHYHFLRYPIILIGTSEFDKQKLTMSRRSLSSQRLLIRDLARLGDEALDIDEMWSRHQSPSLTYSEKKKRRYLDFYPTVIKTYVQFHHYIRSTWLSLNESVSWAFDCVEEKTIRFL